MRNLSCAVTAEQVIARTKTVTRRLGTFWACLKVGEKLCLVRKARGLRKGERVERLAVVEVVDVGAQALGCIIHYGREELAKEGFPGMTPAEFVAMFRKMHKCEPDPLVTRIEWRYVDDTGTEATR